jgi:hypothetical protein
LKNSVIFIVLLLLAVTFFFWFQVLRTKDLPFRQPPSGGTIDDVESIIVLLAGLRTDDLEPTLRLYGRDPFIREEPVESREVVELPDMPVLSSISYSRSNALAVVNGEILAEGDAIPESEFMIESIEVDRVEISDGRKKHTLSLEKEPGIGKK